MTALTHAFNTPDDQEALLIVRQTYRDMKSDNAVSDFLWNKGIGRWLISKLQFVGRMALSNYILQSILGYLVMRTFNGYEYFSAFGCIILVLSIYSFQIIISQLWLTKFQFGPLEWAWRCISYVKILPIRKSM